MLTKLRVGQLRLGILLTLLAALLGGATAAPASAQRLAVAGDHACVVRTSGHVACWGKNDQGQLGDGTTTDRPSPVIVKDVDNAVAVAVSQPYSYWQSDSSWSCALRADGRVLCWGAIEPPADLARPRGLATYVDALDDATSLSMDGQDACAGRANGRLVCWKAGPLIADRAIGSPLDIATIDSTDGSYRGPIVCGLRKTAQSYCWDANYNPGRYPLATNDARWPGALKDFGSVCAIDTSGHVWCYGTNPGNGSARSAAAVQVPGIDDAVQISARGNARCVVRATGALLCWGYNVEGEATSVPTPSATPIINSPGLAVLTPTPVAGIADAVEVQTGGTQTCVLRGSGAIDCWGRDPMPPSNPTRRLSPGALVTGVQDAAALSVGDGFACVARIAGALTCWGNPEPAWTRFMGYRVPSAIIGISDATQVSVGSFRGQSSTCVVRRTGQVACFGPGGLGSISDSNQGGVSAGPALTNVPGIADATQVSVGGSHACALRRDQRVQCWGWNRYLQASPTTPIAWISTRVVDGVTGAVAVSAGDKFSCALQSNGDVRCWGEPARGRIGVISSNPGPRRNPGIENAVAMKVNGASGCALIRGGTVRCWGAGTAGQLGNGRFEDSSGTAVQVGGLTDATSLTVGEQNACAIRAGGTVACWGKGSYGTLGDGKTVANTATPVTVKGLSDAVAIDAGQDAVCALKADHTVVCWGTRTSYQLGDAVAGPQRIIDQR